MCLLLHNTQQSFQWVLSLLLSCTHSATFQYIEEKLRRSGKKKALNRRHVATTAVGFLEESAVKSSTVLHGAISFDHMYIIAWLTRPLDGAPQNGTEIQCLDRTGINILLKKRWCVI